MSGPSWFDVNRLEDRVRQLESRSSPGDARSSAIVHAVEMAVLPLVAWFFLCEFVVMRYVNVAYFAFAERLFQLPPNWFTVSDAFFARHPELREAVIGIALVHFVIDLVVLLTPVVIAWRLVAARIRRRYPDPPTL